MAGEGGDDESPEAREPEEIPSFSSLVDAVEERRKRRRDRSAEKETTFETGTAEQPPRSDTFDWVHEDEDQADVDAESDAWELVGGGGGQTVSAFDEDPKSEAILEVIGDVPNVLLMGPLLGPADYDACTRLIDAVPEASDRLLLVTISQTADERLNVIRGYLGDLPEETVVLEVGGSGRTGTRESVATEAEGSITIETISDPTDLRRIGIVSSRYLSNWADEDHDAVLCLHSITALLQFTDDPRFLFRFLHVLGQKVRQYGATAHYHLDDGAHAGDLVERFRPLFDEVLAFREDGSLSVVR